MIFSNFATNSDSFGLFLPEFSFLDLYTKVYQQILWLKPVLRGLWDINVYWGALMFCKDLFPLIFSNFATNSDKFGILWSFWAFFDLHFYFWTFISINIMVKTSFQRSMEHKCVLECTYVLQRLVSIVFSNFATNSDKFGIIGPFFA